MMEILKCTRSAFALTVLLVAVSACKSGRDFDDTSETQSGTDTIIDTQTGSLSASDTDKGSETQTETPTGTEPQTDETDTGTQTESGSETTLDTETYETDSNAVMLRCVCPIENRLGGFTVALYEKSSTVSGSVADGVVPVNVPDHVASSGDCVLLRRRNLFCDPPCTPDKTCDQNLECISFPLNQNLGTVVVRGLARPVAMEAVMPGSKYFDTKLPHPAVAPGIVVQLETKTGYMGAQELYGIGVEPLALTDTQWLVRDGQPLPIHWTAGSGDARSQLFVSFNIDQHGTSPMRIECQFDDDGEAQVPADLISQLMDAGVTGYPSGTASRRTIDSVSLDDGCVDFAVASPRVATVRVEGYTPCDDDSDCPSLDCDEVVGLCR